MFLFSELLESCGQSHFLCLDHEMFSSCTFKDSRLILKSFIHSELSFVLGERWGSNFSLLHVDVQFFQATC
jgi:hypothetical protein